MNHIAISCSDIVLCYSIFAILFLIVVSAIGAGVAEAGVDDRASCGVEIKRLLHRVVRHIHEFDFHQGDQYLAGVTLQNQCDSAMPIVGFIEVRDSTGVTVALESKFGTWVVGVEGYYSHRGMYWVPEAPGRYEIRAFAISNFTNPEVLTAVSMNQVDIPATRAK